MTMTYEADFAFGLKINAARELRDRLRAAKARGRDRFEALFRLAEELSKLPDGEAWARPRPPEDPSDADQRMFWLNFHATGPRFVGSGEGKREYRGATYGPGHANAPALGERDQWTVSIGTAVSGKCPGRRDDGEPKNLEIGKRLEDAWFSNDESMREVSALSNEFESLIRSIVEAP